MKSHSVKFNAVMNTLLTASNMLISVITLPYVTRVLSVEGYGDVTFAQSLSTWLSALCLVGIPTYGIRECARVRDDPQALAKTVKELLSIVTVFTMATLSVFAACIYLVPRLRSLSCLMWIFLISTLLLSYGVEWFFQATEQYEYITIRSVIFKIISLIAILVFVRHKDDWLIYGAIIALVACANNLFNIARLLRTLSFKNLGRSNLRKHDKSLISFAALSIATAIYQSFDSVLLGLLSPNNIQVAFYQLASKLRNICWQVVNAIVSVLIPRLSYYAKNNPAQYTSLLQRGFGITLNLSLGIANYLLAFAYPLIVLLSSEKYAAAVISVQIIGFVNFFSCLSTFIGLCVLTPLDLERKLAMANMAGVPISLVANFALDGTWGAPGAAVAVLIAEFVIFTVQVHASWKILRNALRFGDILKTLMINVIALMVGFAAAALPLAEIPLLIVGFFIYGVTWLIVGLIVREDSAIWVANTALSLLGRQQIQPQKATKHKK